MKIPRIIHRIWLGGKPMPDDLRRYGETWATHHPEWRHELWTDEHLPELSCGEAFACGASLAEQSDLLRYDLLHQFGGVYVDTDEECVRPIDPLIEGLTAFAALLVAGRVSNAVLGAVPGHPLFELAVREAEKTILGPGKPWYPRTGPKWFTRLVAGREDIEIFEPVRFYPYPKGSSPQAQWPDETYAVHHWATSGREMHDPELELERLRRELERAETRLEAIERSRWWRLGAVIFRWKR